MENFVGVKRVLITGAAGRIGSALRTGLKEHYPVLRLSDIASLGEAGSGEELAPANLCDLAALEDAMDGVDALVHLGATVGESTWDNILQANIIGTYNAFEAARRKGVRRVVYASSIHVHGFYRREQLVGADTPHRPDSRYGVSKVFGEGLGRMYADKFGMEVVCLRIASFRPRPSKPRELGTWISPRDIAQLVRRSLDMPGVHFEVLYGVSRNTRKLYYDPNAVRFGYHPVDNSEDYTPEIFERQNADDEPTIERLFHGAHVGAVEFSGDIEKIV
jgi:uronate dehydrogenase